VQRFAEKIQQSERQDKPNQRADFNHFFFLVRYVEKIKPRKISDDDDNDEIIVDLTDEIST
jgi:hypothetical protein